MTGLLGDLRYAARMLRKHPALAGVSILTLALGIGLTAVMFSIVNGALIRGLPVEEPHEIVHLERTNLEAGIESMNVPIHDFEDWRSGQRSFDDLAAYYTGTMNVSGEERAERYDGAFITPSAFTILGASALRGRLFEESDARPAAAGVVLLSYATWRDHFALAEDVLGRGLRVNGEPMTVVGVMPEHFLFPVDQELWAPLRLDALTLPRGEGNMLEVFGRLRDGVTYDQALQDINTIASRLAIDYPETNEGVSAKIQPFTHEFVGDEAKGLLLTMLGAVFLVLIIACANVANLLLSRAALRGKEVAVRTAHGASRSRVIRQMLVEALVLALAGGAVGLVIAMVGIRAFNSAITIAEPPYWMQFGLMPPVLLFVGGVVLFAALVAGITPAIQASGTDVNAILKDESRGSSGLRMGRLTRWLVTLEIALSVGLLSVAGLMTKSITKLRNADFGFDGAAVYTGRVGLFETTHPDPESRLQFFDALLAEVQSMPEAESAALTTSLPGLGACCWRFAPEGQSFDRDQDYPLTARAAVSPGFFETFGIELRQGRGIEAQDGPEDLPVAVVNQQFEADFFPEGAVGQRIRLGTSETEEPWRTIVGVAENAYMGGVGNDVPNRAGVYIPATQTDQRFISLAVRGRGDPAGLAGPLRDAVARVDRDTPMYFPATMDEAMARSTWFYNIFGSLFMVFGAAALFLATIGLYGVMSFAVSRRTQEVGIRMALGAQPGDVVRMILRQGFGQIVIGVAIGLVLAFFLAKLLVIILFEVSPTDPLIYGAIVLILTVTGLAASVVPARRASRVDPMVAFRYE